MDPAFRVDIVGESMAPVLFPPDKIWPSLPDVSTGFTGSTVPFLSHNIHVAMSECEHDGSWTGDSAVREGGEDREGGINNR